MFTIVTGMPGCGVSSALDTFIRGHDDRAFVKVEHHLTLIGQEEVEAYVGGAIDRVTLLDLLQLPEPTLRKLWPKALQSAMTEVHTHRTNGKRHIVLSLHACWRLVSSSSFISPVNHPALAGVVAEFEVDRVVNLLDDIYDIVASLRGDDRLFQFEPGLRGSHVGIRQLFTVATWREFEYRASQDIATTVGGKPFVHLAVKHPFRTFERLLTNPDCRPVYISHPISAPRKAGMRADDPVVQSVQSLSAELREVDAIALIEPTAIDEFRFAKDPTANGSAVTPRWPPFQDSSGNREIRIAEPELLDRSNPDNAAVILDEQVFKTQVLVHLLQDRIEDQINWRDRQLVTQSTGGVAVFRPFSKKEGDVSGGVYEEVKLYRQLRASIEGLPKAVVYHPPEDERCRQRGALREVIQRSCLNEARTKHHTLEILDRIMQAIDDATIDRLVQGTDDLSVGESLVRLIKRHAPDFPILDQGSNMTAARVTADRQRFLRKIGHESKLALSGAGDSPEFSTTVILDSAHVEHIPAGISLSDISRAIIESLRK
ncbi:hypothetical protein [Geothrix alkalitolerans]|uniref:hypothetical protein n=1 Tax=Geothrix alkalitolerans TaxID=2922724 RepID=UPI001FAFED3A|nr:hypothetical protein [Geothrix alkalitolerans]